MGENQTNQQKQSRPDPAVADPDKDLVSTAGQGLGNQQSGQQTGKQSGQQGSQQQGGQADQQRANR